MVSIFPDFWFASKEPRIRYREFEYLNPIVCVLCNIVVLCSSVLVSGSRINPLRDKVSESWKRMKSIVYRCFRCTKEKLSCMHAKDHQDCTFAFSFVRKNHFSYSSFDIDQHWEVNFYYIIISMICILQIYMKVSKVIHKWW